MRSVLPSWPPAFRRAAGSASESHSDAAGARAAPEDLQLEQALEQQALEEQALEQAFEQLDAAIEDVKSTHGDTRKGGATIVRRRPAFGGKTTQVQAFGCRVRCKIDKEAESTGG